MFKVDIKRIFSAVRTVIHGSRLPREVVWSLSLGIFENRMDNTLSNQIWPFWRPWFEQNVGQETSNILSNLHFHTILQMVVCLCLSLTDTGSRCSTTQNFFRRNWCFPSKTYPCISAKTECSISMINWPTIITFVDKLMHYYMPPGEEILTW